VLVEAALVLPVMVLLVLGIFEFGLLFTSYSTTTASSRSGGRLAATNYAANNASTSAAEQIALSTSADLQVLNNATPVGMAIYKVANAGTGAPTGGFPGPNLVGGCTSNCIRFTWNEAQQKMVRSSGTWSNPDACGVDVDSIGVFVEVEHEHITNFFGATRRVTAHTVMRLEPLPTDGCS